MTIKLLYTALAELKLSNCNNCCLILSRMRGNAYIILVCDLNKLALLHLVAGL